MSDLQDEVLQSFLAVYFKEYDLERLKLDAVKDTKDNITINVDYLKAK